MLPGYETAVWDVILLRCKGRQEMEGSELLWKEGEKQRGRIEIWKYGNEDWKCILCNMERSYIMTTSSFIVAVELGSFNHNQKLENGYLALIALAASNPM